MEQQFKTNSFASLTYDDDGGDVYDDWNVCLGRNPLPELGTQKRPPQRLSWRRQRLQRPPRSSNNRVEGERVNEYLDISYHLTKSPDGERLCRVLASNEVDRLACWNHAGTCRSRDGEVWKPPMRSEMNKETFGPEARLSRNLIFRFRRKRKLRTFWRPHLICGAKTLVGDERQLERSRVSSFCSYL